MFSRLTASLSVASTGIGLGVRLGLALAAMLGLTDCTTSTVPTAADMVVSVKDQRLGLYRDGKLAMSYKVSTSKFGIGDRPGSNCTPLGKHEVIAKIGHGLPKGAVLHSRRWNGEVIKPNAPGRDPIVSRILWLSGLESQNRNAYRRFIYIHGTAEEHRIGEPASYGCVRMRSADIVKLFDTVSIGNTVYITKDALPDSVGASPRKPRMTPPTSEPLDLTSAMASSKPAPSSPVAAAAPTPATAAPATTAPVISSPLLEAPRAVPMTMIGDGRLVPTSSLEKKQPIKGSPQRNGRSALKLPVRGE